MTNYWVLTSSSMMHIVTVLDSESLDNVIAAKGIRSIKSGQLYRFEDHRERRPRIGDEHLTDASLRRLGDIPYRRIKHFAMSCPHAIPPYKMWRPVPWLSENMSVRKCYTLWLVRMRNGKKLYRVSQNMVQQLWALRLDDVNQFSWLRGHSDRFGNNTHQLLERDRGYAYFERIPQFKLEKTAKIKFDKGLNFRGSYRRGLWQSWYRVCDLSAIAKKNRIKGRSKLKTMFDYQQALLRL